MGRSSQRRDGKQSAQSGKAAKDDQQQQPVEVEGTVSGTVEGTVHPKAQDKESTDKQAEAESGLRGPTTSRPRPRKPKPRKPRTRARVEVNGCHGTTYIINPLELPSNQNAAALFANSGIVGTNVQWSSSPFTTPGWLSGTPNSAPSVGSPDVPPTGAVSRTACAQAALAAEQARLQNLQDTHNRNIAIIGATP